MNYYNTVKCSICFFKEIWQYTYKNGKVVSYRYKVQNNLPYVNFKFLWGAF